MLKGASRNMYVGLLVLLFLFIFGMKTPINGLDISLIINLGLFFLFILKYKLRFIDKDFFYLFAFLFVDIFFIVLIPFIHETYDFSILGTKINILISLFNIYYFSLFLKDKGVSEKSVINALVLILFIQSLIIVISLLDSNIALKIASLSKSPEAIDKMMDSYAGARGLGLTSYSAFGLSIIMGLLVILLFYAYSQRYISITPFIVILIISIVASMSAGRTSVFGLFFGSFFLLCDKKKLPYVFMLVGLLLVILYSLLQIDSYEIDNTALSRLHYYALEPIRNFIETGEFSSTSTSYLINKMYFPLTDQQIIFGDGQYTGSDGSYYMHTDAGYMRWGLYYGVVLSLFFYLGFLLFFYFFYRKVENKNQKLLIIFFVLSSFLLHYKGEVVLFAVGYNKVVFLVLFAFLLKSRKNNQLHKMKLKNE